MRSSVRVRVAELVDIPELVRLAEDASAPQRGTKTPPDRASRYAALLAAPERIVLVAVDDRSDRVVGVVVASEDEVGALVPVPAVIISHLVVELAHRRRGVGRSLLASIVRQADERGIDQIVVAVATNDRDANRYLARLGFAPLVVRRIASTAALRRSMGMNDVAERAALRRRRGVRSVLGARVVSRGA